MKYKLTLIFILAIITQLSAQERHFTALTSLNLRARGGDRSANYPADFVLDKVKLTYQASPRDNLKLTTTIRNYSPAFGGLQISEAYIDYYNWRVGSQRIHDYRSNSYYLSLGYYYGLEDKYMTGITYRTKYFSIGYYPSPVTSISWKGDLESARYSNDITRINDEVVHERNQLVVSGGITELRGSIRVGQVGSRMNIAGVLQAQYHNFGIMGTLYNFDCNNHQSIMRLSSFGGLSSGVRTSGWILSGKYSRKIHDYLTYLEGNISSDQISQYVLGVSRTWNTGITIQGEFVCGNKHDWIDPNKFNWLVNINLSYQI